MIAVMTSFLQADQAAWVTKREATKASNFVKIGENIYFFCEPCSDKKPILKIIKSKEVKSVGVKRFYELKINGEGVDLAYVFVKVKNEYKNLAKLTGVPVEGVSETLDLKKYSLDFSISQTTIGELMTGNMLSSYDLINTLMLSYSDERAMKYKEVSDRQLAALTFVMQNIDKNASSIFPRKSDLADFNIMISMMDDLIAAYDSYSSYIEFKDEKMVDKVHYYIKSFDDQLLKVQQNDQ
tara:strand:+ start:347 stop:1063 length:717 start_codon:yes stop_codon:yes gene_type:complete